MTKREVCLEGGAPWGFRMNGGADSGHPLRISRVNPGSKAAQQGVREGDVISAINGTATRLLTNGDSHALLKSAGSSLTLGLNQDNTSSPKRRSRDLNKRDTSAGSSQELNRLNDEIELEQQKRTSTSTTSSSSDPASSKKQGKKSKPSRVDEEKGKEENCDKNECEAENEEGEGKEEGTVEGEKKMSASKLRRLRKSRAKRKIITSDHLEIVITENSGEIIDAENNNNNVNNINCDITVSNEASAIPKETVVSLDEENLNSHRDVTVGNENSDISDEKLVSSSDNVNLNAQKEEILLLSKDKLPNLDIVNENTCSANVCEAESSISQEKVVDDAKFKEKKKSKKSKPRPLNLENVEFTSSSLVGNEYEDATKYSPDSGVQLDSSPSPISENYVVKGAQVLDQTNNEEEIKCDSSSNNQNSQSVNEIENTQLSHESTLLGSVINKKKKHKSKSSKSVVVETFEQTLLVESVDKPVAIESEAEKNVLTNSDFEKTSHCKIENEKLQKIDTSCLDLTQRHEKFIDSDEAAPTKSKTSKPKDKTKKKRKKSDEFIKIEKNENIVENESTKLSQSGFSNDVSDPSTQSSDKNSQFLHIESSSSTVFNEEVDTDCLKMSSLSRDEVRSPVELVLNPPTPTLANEETFFAPDWEIVEDLKSTESSKSDFGKKVAVHDSSNGDLRAEVNNLVIVEDCGDDLTVDDIRTPIIPPDEEKRLRSFLETLDLVKPDNDYEDFNNDEDREEIVVYRHCTRRSSAEPCYIPPPHRHYLDVITEENSDLSDNDRKSDCDKPWENPELIKKNNDIDEIPDDWGDSDQEVEYPSEEDGGIKPWNGCKTLEEVEGVEIVYLDSDNSDETIIEDSTKKLEGKNEPELVVCKASEMGKRQKIDSSSIDSAAVESDDKIKEIINLKKNSDSVVSEVIKNEDSVHETPISKVVVEEKDNLRDILEETPISKVVVKEKDLLVDKKAQIDLIETIPKSIKSVVEEYSRKTDEKLEARKKFFSCDIYSEKNVEDEVVTSTLPYETAVVEKISIDESQEIRESAVEPHSDKKGIESIYKNIDCEKDVEKIDFEKSDALNKNKSLGHSGEIVLKSVEGRNSNENDGLSSKFCVGVDYDTQNTDRKPTKSRNLNKNLETLDLIKVCSKSDGEDRSDSENIYEYIEFRQENTGGTDFSRTREDIKEIKSNSKIYDSNVPKPQVKVDVTATPVLSRQNSSSSGTNSTQCTSKYNQSPTAWSSENEEKPVVEDVSKIFVGKNPETLRELSTKKVISLPNGLRLLEDIGIIQFRGCFDRERSEESYNNNVSGILSTSIGSPDLTCPPRSSSVIGSYFHHKRHSFSPKSCSIMYTPPRSLVNSPPFSLPPDRERWIGIPTATQNTFVCFSPSQTKSAPLPPGPQEAAGLLDLHKKFIERRGYHEDKWRDSLSDLQSPDLIRLEQYSEPVKQRDYTPELLAEAANLLALKEYRESRCVESKSPDVGNDNYDGRNDNEDWLERLKIDQFILSKMNQVEKNPSPSYNPRTDSKFKTKSFSEKAKTSKFIQDERAPLPHNSRNNREFSTKFIDQQEETFNDFRMNEGEKSTPTLKNSTNDGEFIKKFINEDVEMLNELLRELDVDNSIEDDRNKVKKGSQLSTHKLNEKACEVDSRKQVEHSSDRRDNNRFQLKHSIDNKFELKQTTVEKDDNRFVDYMKETPSQSKPIFEELDGNLLNLKSTMFSNNFRGKTGGLCENFEDDSDITHNAYKKQENQENSKDEENNFLEVDINPGLVRERIAKLENRVGATQVAFEQSVDRSRLLALIQQSQKDRRVADAEPVQADETECNRRDDQQQRRRSSTGEMTRDRDNRFVDRNNYCRSDTNQSGDDREGYNKLGDNRQSSNQSSDDRLGNNRSGDNRQSNNRSCDNPRMDSRIFDADDYKISKRGDIAVIGDNGSSRPRAERPKSLPPTGSGTELFRQKMYEEYMEQVAERFERRQQKVIRLSGRPASLSDTDTTVMTTTSASNEALNLEDEFMVKVRQRMSKLGICLDDENNNEDGDKVVPLPKHLQEFAQLGETSDGVWSPAQTPEAQRKAFDFASAERDDEEREPERDGTPPPVIWTPKTVPTSPQAERKSYRPVKFESPPPVRKNPPKSKEDSPKPPTSLPLTPSDWSKQTANRSTTFQSETTTEVEQRLTSSQSADSSLAFSSEINLPRAPNPTITLLQKAREGQLPRGAHYLEGEEETGSITPDDRRPHIVPNEIIYTVKKEYCSEGQDKKPKKIVELGPRKFEGIGPTTKEGIPIVLRSEVKDTNQQKWYKRMYDSLHKAEADKYVTVRYRSNKKDQYPYASAGGYLSEPDRLGYDSDLQSSKYATLDRRRIRNKEKDYSTSTMPRSKYVPDNSVKKPVDVYKNQPGRIEDYEPGRSSISEKEAKQWWDEVLDIFDEQFEQAQNTNRPPPTTPNTGKPFMTYALKESGYESDSTLVFKRRDENLQNQQAMSPAEQKMAYKTIQKGGEVPLHGLRKPAPERPKEPISGGPVPVPERSHLPKRQSESPHRYVESEVTIHYKSPVRAEAKEALSEEELAQRQAETMRRIYQEERRRKYLQELQDMYSRRHTDNFIPSQKSPIPLNRYDDFPNDTGSTLKSRDRTPEPKLVARALYNFVGQSSRELTFRRGDIIYVRRQIDKNWFEGEHNAMIGLFPLNHVEIIPYDGIRTMPKRSSEGQARAKFNFQAQTHLELSLVKGELVVLTRRVDENWFEGRIGNRKGIFPVSYVEVLVEPGERAVSPVRPTTPASSKPVASPASHSMILNGARNSLTHHHYTPPPPVSYTSLSRPTKTSKQDLAPVNQALHIDTQSEPVPYRALYNYKPQNDDELELCEGDLVYVMEKCDDGWYVGSSQRTACFGTFPGNYVQRLPRAQF